MNAIDETITALEKKLRETNSTIMALHKQVGSSTYQRAAGRAEGLEEAITILKQKREQRYA